MKMKYAIPMLAFAGLALAQGTGLVIPPDQPICRLYSILQMLGSVGGVVMMSYGGFNLATTHDATERNNSKALLGGVMLGLAIIWVAPILIQFLVGTSNVCGW